MHKAKGICESTQKMHSKILVGYITGDVMARIYTVLPGSQMFKELQLWWPGKRNFLTTIIKEHLYPRPICVIFYIFFQRRKCVQYDNERTHQYFRTNQLNTKLEIRTCKHRFNKCVFLSARIQEMVRKHGTFLLGYRKLLGSTGHSCLDT